MRLSSLALTGFSLRDLGLNPPRAGWSGDGVEPSGPVSSGEVFYDRELIYGHNGTIERQGKTRFKVGVGDGWFFFIDKTGAGIVPENFGRQAYLHFVDQGGDEHNLPLFFQHDPRWDGIKVGKASWATFGRRGCGQSVAATILNLSEKTDPYELTKNYLPEWQGQIGTFTQVYRNLFNQLQIPAKDIKNGAYGIAQKAAEGKLVMALVRENFAWWGSKPANNIIDHFILFYRAGAGKLAIWDPWWGELVEKADIVEILSAISIEK